MCKTFKTNPVQIPTTDLKPNIQVAPPCCLLPLVSTLQTYVIQYTLSAQKQPNCEKRCGLKAWVKVVKSKVKAGLYENWDVNVLHYAPTTLQINFEVNNQLKHVRVIASGAKRIKRSKR